MLSNQVEGLEARLATLREGIVDIPTAEAAVERAQVSHGSMSENQLSTHILITPRQTDNQEPKTFTPQSMRIVIFIYRFRL